MFYFSSRRRHSICALVTVVQTCALPIFVYQQNGAATDGNVRHIESRKVPTIPIKQQKINDVPVLDAIDHIAYGSDQYAHERCAKQGLARDAPQQANNKHRGSQADGGKEPAMPAMAVAQDADGSNRAGQQGAVEKR